MSQSTPLKRALQRLAAEQPAAEPHGCWFERKEPYGRIYADAAMCEDGVPIYRSSK